jgi:hypothetical protein
MKNYYHLFIIFFLFPIITIGQSKKIKIKQDKTVSFYYSPSESFILKHKENKRILHAFYTFYQAVKTNNYAEYIAILSPNTLSEIREDKLKRKFEKFRKYNVNLIGKIEVQSIVLYEGKTTEPNSIYICTIQLPEGQTIERRVGFDPLKKSNNPNASTMVALHLTKVDNVFKIVILW